MLRESGSEGNGGAPVDVEVAAEVGVVVVLEPVRPTEALVAPPLVSHGFGGDGEDIFDFRIRFVDAPLRLRLTPQMRVDDDVVDEALSDVKRGWQSLVTGIEASFAGFAGLRVRVQLWDSTVAPLYKQCDIERCVEVVSVG